jgi:predicted helicase
VLLAYYLAAIKIEEGFRERTGDYEPFEGIVLTDTFLMNDNTRLPELGPMGRNSTRVKRQNDLPIEVIVGNPPWSAGQKSAGDDNPNIDYPALADRVRETYGRRHKEVTGRGAGKSAGNLYVQAIRWASDRLSGAGDEPARPGVVAFVHPNSLCNGTSLAGMRAALRDEFSDIYVVNLRGDAMKSGDEFRREGDKIFGAGSRNGVQITLLVRNPERDLSQPATLHYAEVPEYSNLAAKFEWLERLGDVTGDEFRTVPPNDEHHWVNLTDGTFDQLMPVCEIGRREQRGDTAIDVHALGLATNCDTYVYSFSRTELVARIKEFIDSYEEAREFVRLGVPVDEATENYQLDSIKWTGTLKQTLKKGQEIRFDESRIREVLYRPFTKVWLYEDDRILSSVRTVSAMFPRRDLTHTHTSSSRLRTTETSSRRSRDETSSTSISSDRTKAGLEPFPGGDPDDARPSTAVRDPGDGSTDGSPRSRTADAGTPAPGPVPEMTGGGVLVASPNSRALFGTLACDCLADLSAVGTNQPTRAIPRRR